VKQPVTHLADTQTERNRRVDRLHIIAPEQVTLPFGIFSYLKTQSCVVGDRESTKREQHAVSHSLWSYIWRGRAAGKFVLYRPAGFHFCRQDGVPGVYSKGRVGGLASRVRELGTQSSFAGMSARLATVWFFNCSEPGLESRRREGDGIWTVCRRHIMAMR